MTGKRALRHGIAVLVGTAALTGALPAVARDRAGTLSFGGRTRSYAVHVPDRPAPRGGFPVVLVFHGGGMQGAGMRRITRLDALADARGFIAVYPDGMDRHWNDGRSTIKNPQDDVGFVSALLDRLARDEAVDGGRVFATGLSNGALFAERLGCDLANRIAGIAPVAGSLPAERIGACRPARHLGVLQIDGTADPIMPYDGGAVADFGGRGEGGQVASVAETAAVWAKRNGCGTHGAAQWLPAPAPADRTRIARIRYAACPADGPVTVLRVVGGGHAWPGGAQVARPALIGAISRQIDASRAIVDFFLALPPRR